MTQEHRGWRAVPPALQVALVAWIVMMAARLAYLTIWDDPRSVRFNLVLEGGGFLSFALATVGSFDLARRLSGRAALGVKIAAIGFAAAFALDFAFGLLNFMDNVWEHRWIYKAYEIGLFAVWFAIPAGLALALWDRVGFAVAVLVIAFATSPPPGLDQIMYGWLDLSSKSGWIFDVSLRILRIAVISTAVVAVARGTATMNRGLAAHGLRSAARALWLRVIAAVGLALLTLMVIGGKGGKGSFEALRLAMLTAGVINILALVQLGLGAVRAARAEVSELARWPLLVGGGAVLWGAGVMLGQLPFTYKLLYDKGGSYMTELHTEYTQALVIALPVIVTVGIGMVAIAINGLAARQGNEQLRAQAQGKGVGFVALMLVSVAIQVWMVPKAQSAGSFMMLTLLAVVAALAATVMMAKLCTLGAEELEREPGLPTASVVS